MPKFKLNESDLSDDDDEDDEDDDSDFEELESESDINLKRSNFEWKKVSLKNHLKFNLIFAVESLADTCSQYKKKLLENRSISKNPSSPKKVNKPDVINETPGKPVISKTVSLETPKSSKSKQ